MAWNGCTAWPASRLFKRYLLTNSVFVYKQAMNWVAGAK